ncbi:hypothetical protein GJ698_15125 [Pseudoduganella sp. FT26W]|uniref:Uncharacterized protein n=1 Tax=Duganella aquatilis TaxID=2666082 RepID=A0A844DAT5_9BURK|nr:hypothetical protein [Duganella aquatilis]MRW85416.1 hypothetical protein [Duganella aquatilis]
MTITAPVPVTPLPPAPNTNDPDNFDDLADARIEAEGPFGDQMNALAANVFSNASEAQTRALQAQQAAADASSAAAAAAASTTAVKWVAGNYADGAAVWSPTSRFSYRHIGDGASAIDPALDAAHWVLQLYALGLGGMIITGSVDLIVTSGGAISVTPATPGLYITLPDATTLAQGAVAFHVFNAGVYDMGVRTKAGVVLGWIRPGTSSVIGVASNATLGGAWVTSNLHKLGVTAMLNVASVPGTTLRRIAIDSTRTLFLFGALYAVVYDSSAQAWGSPMLVRSIPNGGRASGILVGADKVLVASCDGTTGIQSVVLTLTGVTIAPPGTPATATAGANVSLWGDFIAVGAGFAFSYFGSSGGYLRAMTVSGTAPTIGPEVAFGDSLPLLFVSGAVLRAVNYSGSTLACQPYTLSAANLTPGTGASFSSSAGGNVRAFQNAAGNIVAFHDLVGSVAATVFKLTGTTEASTSIAMFASASATSSSLDYVQISATKTAVATASSGSSVVLWNIHIDNGGTSAAGTPDQFSVTSVAVSAIGASGNTARFAVSSGLDLFPPTMLQFDCSGASPVRGSVQSRWGVNSPGKNFSGKDLRHYSLLAAGNNQYAFGGNHGSDACYNAVSIQSLPALGENLINGTLGAAANESWVLTGLTAVSGTLGTTIKRVEAAA